MDGGCGSIMGRLADWDAVDAPLAPLDPDQLDAVLDLGLVTCERPFPGHLTRTHHTHTDKLEASSTASVMSEEKCGSAAENGLFPAFQKLESGATKIDNGQRFLQWFHQVETSLSVQQDQPYRRYIRELEQQANVTGGLETQVKESLDQLSELTLQYEMVSTKTTSLHTACQHLLEEQTRLAEVSQQVQERLQVFTEADKVAQKLTSPTLSVHSETFLPLLARIDESIIYLKKHSGYLECSVYLVKFRACLSRALEMIRSHVKTVLESATAAASTSAPVAPSAHTAFTLFYGKFRAAAPKVRHLIQEVERRAGHSPEYSSLEGDLEQLYLSCRLQLLKPSVQAAVGQLLAVHKRDHCGLVRAGCAFLLHVCEDEQQLHAQFFTPAPPAADATSALEEFLERLCMVLYDNLRPQIIHVQHLETLAELTAILRNEVLGHHCAAHPQLTAFERITRQMLQDVQERLVYRTTVYIRTDILGYQSAPGDLAYPEKLEMMESIAEQLAAAAEEKGKMHSRQNSTSSVASATSMEVGSITARAYSGNSPADLHGMWFPPVRRTLVCLSKLYRCLEKPIFQGLSQEVLSACLQSVEMAADAISTNPKKAKSDGQLFQIKHLLILREQIVPFQVDFQVRETSLDFSKIKTAAMSLFSRRGSILDMSSNNALLEFLLDGTPGVQELLKDSKKEVDRRLKTTCEQFIADSTSFMVGPLQNFNLKVQHFNVMKQEKKDAKLSSQPWGTPDQVRNVIAECQRLIKSLVPQTQRKMQLYLANRETEFILFRPIRSAVLSSFMTLLATLRSEYSLDQQTIAGCPQQEQLAALLTSVMIKPRSRESRYSVDRQMSEDREILESQKEESHEEHNNTEDTNGAVDDTEHVKEIGVSNSEQVKEVEVV